MKLLCCPCKHSHSHSHSFAETIFLPTNAAFKKEGIDLAKTDKV
jgi:hypothetical protein